MRANVVRSVEFQAGRTKCGAWFNTWFPFADCIQRALCTPYNDFRKISTTPLVANSKPDLYRWRDWCRVPLCGRSNFINSKAYLQKRLTSFSITQEKRCKTENWRLKLVAKTPPVPPEMRPSEDSISDQTTNSSWPKRHEPMSIRSLILHAKITSLDSLTTSKRVLVTD